MGSCELTLIVVRVMSSSFANDNSERYRKCAAEVRALAVEMTNRKSKVLILKLAKDYDWLAKWVEERAGSLPYAAAHYQEGAALEVRSWSKLRHDGKSAPLPFLPK